MEYKNKKTGATFSSPCVISGGDWVLAGSEEAVPIRMSGKLAGPIEPQVQSKKIEEAKTGNADFDAITTRQIKQELDAFGITYNPRANKTELFDLMMKQGK